MNSIQLMILFQMDKSIVWYPDNGNNMYGGQIISFDPNTKSEESIYRLEASNSVLLMTKDYFLNYANGELTVLDKQGTVFAEK